MEGNRRLYGMQMVRATACLGILAAHSCAYAEMNFDNLTVASSLDFWGRYGLLFFVEIFFAMSGFFLSASIDRISDTYPTGGTLLFLKKRALRIYPIYWVAIAAAVLLHLAVKNAYTSTANFLKVFFLFPLSNVPYVLNIEWTLLTEVVFSIFAALFASPKRKRFYPVAVGVWGCVILAMLATGKSDFGIALTMPGIFFSGRGLSLILGSLIYYLYKNLPVKTIKNQVGWCLIVLLFAGFLINYQYLLLPAANSLLGRVLHYGIVAALVLVAAGTEFRRDNPLVLIGDYSFTIYLIHPTILDLSFWLFQRWGYSFHWWMCALAAAASLLAGIALGKVEQGLSAGIKRLQLERRRPASIPWKKHVAWLTAAVLTAGCFSCLYLLPKIQKSEREKFSPYSAAAFDSAGLEESELNSGWVDNLEFNPVGDGAVTVSAYGWAYNPIANSEVSQIAVLADGKSVPVSIAWHDRPSVREALGEPVPISCGFTLKTEPVPTAVNLEFYVILENGRFIPLACLLNTVTG